MDINQKPFSLLVKYAIKYIYIINLAITFLISVFYLGYLSQTFSNHRTFTHKPGEYSRQLTSAHR